MFTVVDLTYSDDDDDAPMLVGHTPAPPRVYAAAPGQPPPPRTVAAPRSTQGILAAALARAGGSSYSGATAPAAPTGRAAQLADMRQALYGASPFGQTATTYAYYAPVVLAVASKTTFRISCDGAPPPAVATVARATPGARHDGDGWILPLGQHINTCVALQNAGVRFEAIPQRVLASLQAASNDDDEFRAGNARMDDDGYARGADDEADSVSDIPRSVWRALAPFQRYGVSWIVKNNGRALLADEPGLGKTIQAVGAACAYYHEWPLLVVAPSSARFHWEAEFRSWLPDEDYLPPGEEGVVVLTSARAAEDENVMRARVIVTSYDLVHRPEVQATLSRVSPNVVICDESHYLKNGKARRTQALMPLLKAATRVILLSGTPALSRPNEIFWQLHAIDESNWPDPTQFAKRYCQGRRTTIAKSEDETEGGASKGYTAASNLEELHTLLRASVMLRRNKAAILKQLPAKKRTTAKVPIDDPGAALDLKADLEEFRARASELAELSGTRSRKKYKPAAPVAPPQPLNPGDPAMPLSEEEKRRLMAQQKKALLMSLFRRTGPAKLPAISRRVAEILKGPGKVLVFAHHRVVLDTLSRTVLANVPHIRIDGTTAARDRQVRATKFQADAKIRVALLGITAAGVALTLTAASRVLFTELYWTPAALVQAEDRAHRIGQTAEVQVEYLLADDTVDDLLWPLIHHKMKLLGELFDNEKDVDLTEKDKKRPRAASVAAAADDDDEAAEDSESEEELILDDELAALDKEDEEAVDIAKKTDEKENDDGRASPVPPPKPAAPAADEKDAALATMLDDNAFAF